MRPFMIIAFCLFAIPAQAQKTLPVTAETLASYLGERSHDLELRLYKMAIVNRLKAYYSDSLQTVLDTVALKERGATWFELDDGEQQIPFVPETGLKGLAFHTTQYMSDPETQVQKLKSVSISYTPVFSSIALPSQPLCHFSWQEIKEKLPSEDVAFLTQLYQVKVNDEIAIDTATEYPVRSADIAATKLYRWDNKIVLNRSYYPCHPMDYHQLAEILLSELPARISLATGKGAAVFTDTAGKSLSVTDIERRHDRTEILSFNSDPRDPVVIVDTAVLIAGEFENISSFAIKGKNQAETLYIQYDIQSGNNPRTYVYSISFDLLRQYHVQPWMVYFLEDYFRYKTKP